MKLVQINASVNTGSIGRIAEEIGRTALGKGWSSYIAYGRDKCPSQSELIKIGTSWDINIHGLQTRLFDRHGFGSVNATRKVVEQIRIIKPDIIHLHNLHGYYLNIKTLFNYLAVAQVPVIWTLHDCWPMTGHCTHFEFIKCKKWQTNCSMCPQKKEYPTSIGLDSSKNNYLLKKELFTSINNITLVPVSKWLEKIVKESYLKNMSVQLINNGIDLATFKKTDDSVIRSKYELNNKIIILGCAGIWSKSKGLNDFLKLGEMIDEKYRIVLVGLSSDQIKKLPENITGIKKTENTQELATLYSLCNVFINPTWEDNFPTTNIEALACGTPVITYKTGGSVESISPETGFVVDKGDIQGLVKCIKQIERNGKDHYSNDCIKRAHALYNKEDRFNDYIKLYENIIQYRTR